MIQQLILLRARLLELREEAHAAAEVISEIDPTDIDKMKAANEYSKRRIPVIDAEIVRIHGRIDQIAKELKPL